MHLPADLAIGPDEAFIVHTEFASCPCGREPARVTALRRAHARVEMGWAVLPAVVAGDRPPTLAMLYSPRDVEKLEGNLDSGRD